jgi:hypothetical protein
MTWLEFFLILWALILSGVSVFVVVDARNAYDGDPATATLSGYIKQWRRRRPYRTPLLGGCVCSLVLVPVYLFLHLVLERI